jgi:hypothetical protein
MQACMPRAHRSRRAPASIRLHSPALASNAPGLASLASLHRRCLRRARSWAPFPREFAPRGGSRRVHPPAMLLAGASMAPDLAAPASSNRRPASRARSWALIPLECAKWRCFRRPILPRCSPSSGGHPAAPRSETNVARPKARLVRLRASISSASARWAEWPLRRPSMPPAGLTGAVARSFTRWALSRSWIRRSCRPRTAHCGTSSTPGREARAVRGSEPERCYTGWSDTTPFPLHVTGRDPGQSHTKSDIHCTVHCSNHRAQRTPYRNPVSILST